MKDQRKDVVEDTAVVPVLEQTADFARDEDTQQMRTLTVQEVERLLKEKKPSS